MKKIIIYIVSIILGLCLILFGVGLYLTRNSENDIKNASEKCTYKYGNEEFKYDCIENANEINELSDIDYIVNDYSPYDLYSYTAYLMNDKNYVLVGYDENKNIKSIKNIDKYSETDFTNLKFTKVDLNTSNLKSDVTYKHFDTNATYANEDETGEEILKLIEDNGEYRLYFTQNYKIELKDNVLYANDKKVNFDNKVKKVFITEGLTDCLVHSKVLLLTTDSRLYYFDTNNGKVKEINSKYKFTDVYEANLKRLELPILVARTENDEYYSLDDNRILNYVYKYNIYDDSITYINLDGTIDNKNTIYKAKEAFGNYVVTTENRLFSLKDNKLVDDKEIKEVYVKRIVEDDDFYLIYIRYADNTNYVVYDYYNDGYINYCAEWYSNVGK